MPPSSETRPAAHNVVTFPILDSTNAEAMRRALAGEKGPLWIVAERQTGGRGRSGRSWVSEPGSLHASLLTVLPVSASEAAQLSLVAGVGAIDAIRAAMSLEEDSALRLKWPNDVLIGRAKTGGILVESSVVAGGLAAVIGIGINIASHPGGLDQPATHLGAHGSAPDPAMLRRCLADHLAHWLAVWDAGRGFGAVRAAWLERAHPLGERLSINTGQGPVEGLFRGLAADGALLISDQSGAEQRYSFGDVTLPA
jgi:BirA family biotin operon repressor/biotin-[acetyl-CoA-carboxylase] ligase